MQRHADRSVPSGEMPRSLATAAAAAAISCSNQDHSYIQRPRPFIYIHIAIYRILSECQSGIIYRHREVGYQTEKISSGFRSATDVKT